MRADPHASFFFCDPDFLFSLIHIFVHLLTYLYGLARSCSPTPFILGHQLFGLTFLGDLWQNQHHRLPTAITQTFTGERAGGRANYLRFIAKQQAEISHRLFPHFPTKRDPKTR